MLSALVSADRSARRTAANVSRNAGVINASKSVLVTRTETDNPGSVTGTTASTSLDSASLASTHSRLNLATPAVTSGSAGSNSASGITQFGEDLSEDGFVEVDAAQMLHPVGRTQDPEADLLLLQDAHVEGAPTQVIDDQLVARRQARPRRVLRGGGLGLGARHRPGKICQA